MLITAVCLALTALLAGLTGTWSPCGLSSVDTLGTGLGRDRRRGRTALCVALFTVAAIVGGAVTFGAAAALGGALSLGGHAEAALVAAGLAVAAGVADLRFLPVVPQIRRQVPEAIRWRLALPATAGLYGLLLGLGFTTYLLTYAMWALVAACVLLGEPALGVTVGAVFGLGRALPVLVLVPRFERESTQQFIADMERGPTLVGLRRIDGAALLVCALAVVPVAVADARTSVRGGMADPGVADGDLVFQVPDGGGRLERGGNPAVVLPGRDPAIGGPYIAWRVGDEVTVADRATLTPVVVLTVPGVQELAIAADWLVYRRADGPGRQIVGARPLAPGGVPADRFASTDAISRPAISGSTVVYAVAGRRGSRIEALDLASGARRTVRGARASTLLDQPTIREGRLAYVRSTPCEQELRVGTLEGRSSADRVRLRLRGVATQDGGTERGYVDDFNAASKCPRRRFTASPGVLWTTALSASGVFVTRLPLPDQGGAAALIRVSLAG